MEKSRQLGMHHGLFKNLKLLYLEDNVGPLGEASSTSDCGAY